MGRAPLGGMAHFVGVTYVVLGVHSTLDGHSGFLPSRFYGNGDKNIAQVSGAVGMMSRVAQNLESFDKLGSLGGSIFHLVT